MTTFQKPSLDLLIADLSPIHFVGVNGSGMRPLAEFTASFESQVTGSDRDRQVEHSSINFALEKTDQESSFLKAAKTVVVSSAIPKNHPALIQATQLGKIIMHRSEFLAVFTKAFKTVTIAGTHGKTTTSALISHILYWLGADPSWVIGASFSNGLPAYRRGGSDILIIEADESDGSFLRYTPFVAVLNNVESDHMDHFKTFANLKYAFKSYVELAPPDGCLSYFSDDLVACELAIFGSSHKISFGTKNSPNYFLQSLEARELNTHISFSANGNIYRLNLPLTGKHNAFNALAAISVCEFLGISVDQTVKALEEFPGVKRRLQKYPASNGQLVFDDYAHNPGKILSCVTGLREAFPRSKIHVVFQPHRFSRISSLYDGFKAAFNVKNISVIVLPVYAAGEEYVAGYDAETIARDISQTCHVETFSVTTLKQAVDLVKSKVNSNRDIILSLGAGDVWKVAAALGEEL